MNKSLATNLVAAAILALGLILPESAFKPYVISAGLFALSGAVTNWLAIHMLFERVPGLYGSGVIAARFEEFKAAISRLVMENFFTEENFLKFADVALHQGFNRETLASKIDLDSLFDGFLEMAARSKFGSMLKMFGGSRALEPLRDPFKDEFQGRIASIIDSMDLSASHVSYEAINPMITSMVQGKLDELEANEVKELLSRLMREHLGWLVIWGGIFGAIIGTLSVPLQAL